MTHHPKTCSLGRIRRAAAVLVFAGSAALTALAAPLDDIRRQVDAGQYDQAYQTGLANPQMIGDVHFDFLYGIAAINSGRVPEGLLALERHLSAVPANDRARLELAKGYYLLGEYGRARSEFELVLSYNPPAGVRASINAFLQTMQVRQTVEQRSGAKFYIEIGAGHDSNVNGGTFHDTVAQVGTLDPKSRQIADDGALFAIGGQQTWRVSNRLSLFGGADLDHRSNRRDSAREFDLSNIAIYAGFSNLAAGGLWRTTLAGSTMLLGDNRYRDKTQIGTEATWSFGPELYASGLVQYAEQRYADDNERARDSRLVTLEGSGTWSPAGWPWLPSLVMRLTHQQEDTRDRRRGELNNSRTALRATLSVSPRQDIRLQAGGWAEGVDYTGDNLVFGTTRRDETYGIDAAANWAIDSHWTLRGEASWIVVRSNQDLYATSRKTLSIKLRYQY